MNQDTKTRLLETALELIWQSNYNSVGVNEICKEAGVTKGGFYHHFESKADLFCEASTFYWEKIRKDLDTILSPSNTPLEQLANMLNFIYINKFGDDVDNIPGSPFFNGMQNGCGDVAVQNSLQCMSNNGLKYTQALVRSLQSGGYLEGEGDIEQKARLISQYLQGATSYARINRCCLDMVKKDVASAVYTLLGLKREHWFTTQPTWPALQQAS
ncbi:MAG: TetR/AcrR family transcriptional regulator [Pseudomonadota bacterium]